VDEVADRLEARVPPQREVTLVHGDYHLRNVLFDPDDGSVRAVLDWELCTLGDPLADLGGLLAYWPRPGDPAVGPNPTSMVDGFPERDDLAEAYWAETGRGLDDLPFWHALACWKVAIIIEGVRRRASTRGNAEAPPAQLVDDLLERARTIAADA
jgi:aminoglycoside phosphotransferase (APT) family kinase protein